MKVINILPELNVNLNESSTKSVFFRPYSKERQKCDNAAAPSSFEVLERIHHVADFSPYSLEIEPYFFTVRLYETSSCRNQIWIQWCALVAKV